MTKKGRDGCPAFSTIATLVAAIEELAAVTFTFTWVSLATMCDEFLEFHTPQKRNSKFYIKKIRP